MPAFLPHFRMAEQVLQSQSGVGLGVGGVGLGVGRGVGNGVGRGVGNGVGYGVGCGVGLGVGTATHAVQPLIPLVHVRGGHAWQWW